MTSASRPQCAATRAPESAEDAHVTSNFNVEPVPVEPIQHSLLARAGAVAQVKKRYRGLRQRYGLGYTIAMLSAVCLAFFLPIPGTSLFCIGLIGAIAEIHRAISERRRLRCQNDTVRVAFQPDKSRTAGSQA